MAENADLEDDRRNLDWMRRRYSTKEYWSEELQWGNRWQKDAAIKDYRSTGATVDRYVRPFLGGPVVNTGLEIGPGGGRWTAELLRICGKLHLIDISESVLDVCRDRFRPYHNVQYHLTDERADLSVLADGSVDLIFSWGVLVHVSSGIVENYVAQFQRILSPGGVVIVQHGNYGTNLRENRSNVTKAWFEDMADRNGLTIRAQIGTSEGFYPEYKDGKQRVYLDTLAILGKTLTR